VTISWADSLPLPLLPAFMTRAPARQRSRGPGTDGGSEVDDDAALVARAAGGDHQAFGALHRRHIDFLWRRLTHLLGPDPDREDLVQQIFLEVFRGLGRFRGEAKFRSYLYQVMVHVACDHLRRRRKRPQPIGADAIEVVSDPDASPEARAVDRQRLALTWTALDRIKPKKRVAFILRMVEGMSLDEVAELVGATVPTVAKRVKHAQDELHRMLARKATGPKGER
jgi:RNA polymerase sigma-70 factor, ECF subfamily